METFKNCIGASNESIMKVRVSNAEKNALAQSKIMIEKLKIDYANLQNEIENKITDLILDNENIENILVDVINGNLIVS